MAARTHSADPRAERLRARLRDAALTLVTRRPVDELTVADLVAHAGVSRQAFYQHFGDRDDAIATAFTAAFAAATTDLDGDARTRILRLFDFAAEHRAMYRHVVGTAVAQRVVSAFRAELLPACTAIAEEAAPVLGPAAALSPEAVSRFLVGGFMEVLRSWMEDPHSDDLRTRVTAALDTVYALLGL
ncbi:TetR/AcrR family transcriptional regulator [Mycolicibacterium litorale]|uniref:TetR family transcriptional regulator n=1 Tax=Mycolicibacterium litorale TaxID=758802 RepID=A0AAD1IJL6_9MYCO|nr:TetR/AcrR family transcriptional regulator [Mycolicibacterium litorale]MCV7414806.1 TetR/AcrR family transcriptional regulator [Mycolicibacterium litorale]TDY08051.1 TetR family transcriptional regulator [Mycolicibacterium litorale]BBY15971.1 TetR family transcriptional regulator [Mycolicibacterium litorale]